MAIQKMPCAVGTGSGAVTVDIEKFDGSSSTSSFSGLQVGKKYIFICTRPNDGDRGLSVTNTTNCTVTSIETGSAQYYSYSLWDLYNVLEVVPSNSSISITFERPITIAYVVS